MTTEKRVLFVGEDSSFFQEAAEELGLADDQIVCAKSETELHKLCRDIGKVELVLVDLFYLGSCENKISTDLAIRQLREAGYKGTIAPCTNSPIANGYLCKLTDVDYWPVWKGASDSACPKLSVRQVCEVIEPLLMS
jgi:hypothetical protein